MKLVKIGISGVRDVVEDSLTPQLCARFVQAFGSYLGIGKVIVGQDARISGIQDTSQDMSILSPMLWRTFIKGEMASPNLEDGLQNQKVIEAVLKSAEAKKWVNVG